MRGNNNGPQAQHSQYFTLPSSLPATPEPPQHQESGLPPSPQPHSRQQSQFFTLPTGMPDTPEPPEEVPRKLVSPSVWQAQACSDLWLHVVNYLTLWSRLRKCRTN